MRRWLPVIALLSLPTPVAQANSVFLADAIFDFESTSTTSPADGSGTGAFDAFNAPNPALGPLVVSAGDIQGTFSRGGLVQPGNVVSRFDVKALDGRFPESWGGAALDPFFLTGVPGTSGGGDGSDCAAPALIPGGTRGDAGVGCTPFLAQFDTTMIRASVEFSTLSTNILSTNMIQIQVAPGVDDFGVVVPISGNAFAEPISDTNGDGVVDERDDSRPIPVTPDQNATGTLFVECSFDECGEGHFVTVEFFAAPGESFRTILFRGFRTLNGDGITSNTMYVDNIAVGTGIPEPAAAALLGFGLAAIFGLARQRRE